MRLKLLKLLSHFNTNCIFATMNAGRKRKESGDPQDVIYSNKSRTRPSTEAHIDQTYGQRSALPEDDVMASNFDDVEYIGDSSEALSYLRSVR